MTLPSSKTAVDNAVAAAKDLPDLIAKASAVDPALASALQGKALLASKTPLGNVIATAAAYASTKFGFGWDEMTCDLVSLVVLAIASYAMRYISPARITGLFSKS